jgi:hypothetical protein
MVKVGRNTHYLHQIPFLLQSGRFIAKISPICHFEEFLDSLEDRLLAASKRSQRFLFPHLVSHRYQSGSILITTNKGIKDWPEILAGDEVLATANLDRLLHNSHVLDINGRSYHLRDLERAMLGSIA